MGEVEMPHCFGYVSWLFRIKRTGLAFANRAESAVTGADVAAQHKGCSPISPALENVGALRFLTNSVQVQTFDQLEQMILIRRIAQTNPQPLRFWLTGFWVQDSEFAGQSDLPHSMKTF